MAQNLLDEWEAKKEISYLSLMDIPILRRRRCRDLRESEPTFKPLVQVLEHPNKLWTTLTIME